MATRVTEVAFRLAVEASAERISRLYMDALFRPEPPKRCSNCGRRVWIGDPVCEGPEQEECWRIRLPEPLARLAEAAQMSDEDARRIGLALTSAADSRQGIRHGQSWRAVAKPPYRRG